MTHLFRSFKKITRNHHNRNQQNHDHHILTPSIPSLETPQLISLESLSPDSLKTELSSSPRIINQITPRNNHVIPGSGYGGPLNHGISINGNRLSLRISNSSSHNKKAKEMNFKKKVSNSRKEKSASLVLAASSFVGPEKKPSVSGKRRKNTKKKSTKKTEGETTGILIRRKITRKKNTGETVAREKESISDGEYIVQSIEDNENDYMGAFAFDQISDSEKETLGPNFSCLTPEEIIQTQKKLIQSISELLNISASNAANLLRHYQWRVEVLHQQYWTSPDKVLKEAGLMCVTPDAEEDCKFESEGECLVCCEIIEGSQSTALRCRHRFCNDCWRSYLSVKITEGEVSRINCPALNCKYTIPDPMVQKLVPKEIYEKYLRFVTKAFVEDNAHITWCPSSRCGNAITADMLHGTTVKCRCGFCFCFSCHHEAHSPATCDQVKLWLKKCNDDSETGHWLGANTKDCPRCTVLVEKNGGCNHMTCRQCSHEWCWMCNKPWKGHTDYYACSRYEKAQKKKEKSKKNKKKQSKIEQLEAEREAKRVALERYLTFYTKYLEYDARVKQSSEIREKTQDRIKTFLSEQTTLAQVKFLETGTETLLDCHHVLKFSYVYSYYLADNCSEQLLFMMNQQELEKTTQMLEALLSEEKNILKRRTEMVDLTKHAQKRKESIIKATQLGLVESEVITGAL